MEERSGQPISGFIPKVVGYAGSAFIPKRKKIKRTPNEIST